MSRNTNDALLNTPQYLETCSLSASNSSTSPSASPSSVSEDEDGISVKGKVEEGDGKGGKMRANKFSFPGSNKLLPFPKPLIFHERRRHKSHHHHHDDAGDDDSEVRTSSSYPHNLDRLSLHDDTSGASGCQVASPDARNVNFSFGAGDDDNFNGLEDEPPLAATS